MTIDEYNRKLAEMQTQMKDPSYRIVQVIDDDTGKVYLFVYFGAMFLQSFEVIGDRPFTEEELQEIVDKLTKEAATKLESMALYGIRGAKYASN